MISERKKIIIIAYFVITVVKVNIYIYINIYHNLTLFSIDTIMLCINVIPNPIVIYPTFPSIILEWTSKTLKQFLFLIKKVHSKSAVYNHRV